MALTVKSDYSRVPAWLAMVKRAVDTGLTNAALAHKNAVNAHWSKSGRHGSSTPGSPPGVRRGWLKNHLATTPGRNGRASSGVAKGVPYARRLELGSGIAGPIRAKGGGALAVPANDQARRLMEANPKLKLRSLDLVMIKPRGRAPFLVAKEKMKVTVHPGGGKRVTRNTEPVWVLKKSVFIKARPYLRPRAKDPSIAKAFHTAADRYIKANARVALGGAR